MSDLGLNPVYISLPYCSDAQPEAVLQEVKVLRAGVPVYEQGQRVAPGGDDIWMNPVYGGKLAVRRGPPVWVGFNQPLPYVEEYWVRW